MDITETTAPRSDQQNFDDYSAGPRVVTITEVKAGSAEQPVEIHLAEYPGRPYKPSKSMRRVLVACWGPESSEYVGRRMKLVGDPTVKFGGVVVGGIKIAALSHIDKAQNLALTVKRGKRAPHKVEPLTESEPTSKPSPIEPSVDQVSECADADILRGWWKSSGPERRAQIETRVAELDNPPTPDPADELPIGGEGA